jgi:hypothetical protein
LLETLLSLQPLFEAVVMNETDTSSALAATDQRVILLSGGRPAEPATIALVVVHSLGFLLPLSQIIVKALYLFELKELLIIYHLDIGMLDLFSGSLIDFHSGLLDNCNFFDSEFNSTEFDYVTLLKLVFYFVVIVLQASDD